MRLNYQQAAETVHQWLSPVADIPGLVRVLAKRSWLIVGAPVSLKRVAFNAHRIFSPLTVIEWFSELKLVNFSVITDGGQFRRFAEPRDYINADYACGLYLFRRAA